MHLYTHYPYSLLYNKVTILIIEPSFQFYTSKPISISQPMMLKISLCKSNCNCVNYDIQKQIIIRNLCFFLSQLPLLLEHMHQCNLVVFQTPTTITHTTCHKKVHQIEFCLKNIFMLLYHQLHPRLHFATSILSIPMSHLNYLNIIPDLQSHFHFSTHLSIIHTSCTTHVFLILQTHVTIKPSLPNQLGHIEWYLVKCRFKACPLVLCSKH